MENSKYIDFLKDIVDKCSFTWDELLRNNRNGDIKDTCYFIEKNYGVPFMQAFEDMKKMFLTKEQEQVEEVRKITESQLKQIIKESVKRILSNNQWYVLWDGTSVHTVQGYEVEDEMAEYDIDSNDVHGPFRSEEEADLYAEEMFDEAYGSNMGN